MKLNLLNDRLSRHSPVYCYHECMNPCCKYGSVPWMPRPKLNNSCQPAQECRWRPWYPRQSTLYPCSCTPFFSWLQMKHFCRAKSRNGLEQWIKKSKQTNKLTGLGLSSISSEKKGCVSVSSSPKKKNTRKTYESLKSCSCWWTNHEYHCKIWASIHYAFCKILPSPFPK